MSIPCYKKVHYIILIVFSCTKLNLSKKLIFEPSSAKKTYTEEKAKENENGKLQRAKKSIYIDSKEDLWSCYLDAGLHNCFKLWGSAKLTNAPFSIGRWLFSQQRKRTFMLHIISFSLNLMSFPLGSRVAVWLYPLMSNMRPEGMPRTSVCMTKTSVFEIEINRKCGRQRG